MYTLLLVHSTSLLSLSYMLLHCVDCVHPLLVACLCLIDLVCMLLIISQDIKVMMAMGDSITAGVFELLHLLSS